MRDHLLFHLNGQAVRVAGEDAFLSLSDFLRKRQQLTGTKVVCAEGDCGSCSVLVGRRDGQGRFRYATITSCIAMVFQLDGTHVVTVEGLSAGGKLNAIQRAMVARHGAQCGFCTPGFVVTLQQFLGEEKTTPTRETATRALAGNLCRCTGYDAILRAACEVDPMAVPRIDELYPGLPTLDREDVLLQADARRIYVPRTLEQALRFRTAHPACTIVSGATDLGVLVNKRTFAWSDVLVLNDVAELRRIEADARRLVIGAAVSLSDLERFAREAIPPLGEFLSWFGSLPIKNAGTIGGNLGTGSPIGDAIPALMAMGAEVELRSLPRERGRVREGDDVDGRTLSQPTDSSSSNGPLPGPPPCTGEGTRSVPLDVFYTGYRQSVRRPEELITAVHIPRRREGEMCRIYKVSRRLDLDISTVSMAFSLRERDGVIDDIRIAAGGVAATALRLRSAENALRGKPFSLDAFEAAAGIARGEVKPLTDVRGSAEYRLTLVGNLFLKAFHELDAERNMVR